MIRLSVQQKVSFPPQIKVDFHQMICSIKIIFIFSLLHFLHFHFFFDSLPEEETENQAPNEDNPPPVPPLPRDWTPVPVNTHLTSMPAVSELKLSNAEKSKR